MEGRLWQNIPHAEMRYVLVICHTTIPNLQHIQIIPSARLPFIKHRSSFIEDIHHGAMEAW